MYEEFSVAEELKVANILSPSASAPTYGTTVGCSMTPRPGKSSTTSVWMGWRPLVAGLRAHHALNGVPASRSSLTRLVSRCSQSGASNMAVASSTDIPRSWATRSADLPLSGA